ncbi:MAG: hypothetical protein GYA52_00765 [Chloroflexi bacterium]|nr:hypothetical protein [Chloroflexota bacterium]
MITFIKLGGSLITEKDKAFTARKEMISCLVAEIKQALQEIPDLQIVLGHGSGSFGHAAAKQYDTHLGVHTPHEWQGFVKVRRQADALHRLVMDELWDAGLTAISFPPSALVVASDHHSFKMETNPLQQALEHHLMPVVFGDVVFDQRIGGTILSTEEILSSLCNVIPFEQIIIAGVEQGVWKDARNPQQIYTEMTPHLLAKLGDDVSGSRAPDVTGGMRSKVEILFSILASHPRINIQIISGMIEGNLLRAMHGEQVGTHLKQA